MDTRSAALVDDPSGSLERLQAAAGVRFIHLAAEGVRAFSVYDRWIGIMRDQSVRDELKRLRPATRDDSPLWREVHSIGQELQRGLDALLLGTPLRALSIRYAIF